LAPFFRSISDFLAQVATQLTLLIIVGLLRLFGVDIFARILKAWRLFLLLMRKSLGHEAVLLYTDCDVDGSDITDRFAERLALRLAEREERIDVLPLKAGDSLQYWPLSTWAVRAVVLLVTDITKLSAYPKRRKRIEKRLARFCQRGGTLVLGHDVIYRRAQNSYLERLAGCKLTRYEAAPNGVAYVKVVTGDRVSTDRHLLDDLPGSLNLKDGEIITGNWAEHVEYLYILEGRPDWPLATRKTYGSGLVFWINSGDQGENGPPRSISKPSPDLLKVMAELIKSKR
jgi:hypothetical protein